MEKLSKKEIDARLRVLRQSRMNKESYDFTRPALAMCYSMGFPRNITVVRKCAQCGKEYEITFSTFDRESVETYDTAKRSKSYTYKCVADYFIEVGMQAMLVTNCDECVKADKLNPYEFCIRAHDEEEWRVSVPSIVCEDSGTVTKTSFYEYGLVLDFLKAVDNKKIVPKTVRFVSSSNKNKPKRLSYKGIIPDEATFNREDAGFIKTKVDLALTKVLGVDIIYDIDEVKKNIITLYEQIYKKADKNDRWNYNQFSAYAGKNGKALDTKNALNKLEQTNKSEFSLAEYIAFVNSILGSQLYETIKISDRNKSNYKAAYDIFLQRDRVSDEIERV